MHILFYKCANLIKSKNMQNENYNRTHAQRINNIGQFSLLLHRSIYLYANGITRI